MDMYEITLNVMYTAAILVAMFTGTMWLFKAERTSEFIVKLIVCGWLLNAAIFICASISLIWMK